MVLMAFVNGPLLSQLQTGLVPLYFVRSLRIFFARNVGYSDPKVQIKLFIPLICRVLNKFSWQWSVYKPFCVCLIFCLYLYFGILSLLGCIFM